MRRCLVLFDRAQARGGGDVRLPGNLINGVNNTFDPSNMWLAPYTPGKDNNLWIVLDSPVTLSMVNSALIPNPSNHRSQTPEPQSPIPHPRALNAEPFALKLERPSALRLEVDSAFRACPPRTTGQVLELLEDARARRGRDQDNRRLVHSLPGLPSCCSRRGGRRKVRGLRADRALHRKGGRSGGGEVAGVQRAPGAARRPRR